MREGMIAETTAFGASIFFSEEPYARLLTSPKTVINSDLAAIYGVPFAGTGFQPVTLDPGCVEAFLASFDQHAAA